MIKLHHLQKDTEATIIEILDSEAKQKLMEMGIVPGAKIKLHLKAPSGDPLAFIIDHNYCLSMRIKEASSILVETFN